MIVKDLIARLSSLDPNSLVMILDGFNGGGSPREINLGPTTREVTTNNAEETCDCEDLVGVKVVVLGFGCY